MTMRPLQEEEPVALEFKIIASDNFIEEHIDSHGTRPSQEWSITFTLDDLRADLRKPLREAYDRYLNVEPYPVFDSPTDDPMAFLAAIDPWLDETEAVERKDQREANKQRRKDAAAQKRFVSEMKKWAKEHGSDRLKNALSRGYKTNTTYAIERSGAELPGFWVDTADDTAWGSRNDPSEAALTLETEIVKQIKDRELRLDPRIVWLTEAPRALDRWLENEGGLFEPQEAIAIREYLDRYDIVLPVDHDLHRPEMD